MGRDLTRPGDTSLADGYLALLGDEAVVMHGPRPEDVGLSGRDVDIFVRGIDLTWPLRLPAGSRITQELRYDFGAWYWVVDGPEGAVALDTTDDPRGFGRDTVRTDELLDRMRGVAMDPFRAAYLAIKRIRKRDLRAAEWRRIGDLAGVDPGSFEAALRLEVGERIATALLPWALEGTPPPPEIAVKIDRLRYLRRFGTPSRAVQALAIASHRWVQRLLHPSGFVVLLVGPDGTGKSTLATHLLADCRAMFKRDRRVHWRPGLLPRPGKLAGKPASDPTEPHVRPAFGPLVSLGLLGYYWTDFLIGDLVTLRHARIRSGLIVQERGWWDIAVDPRRYRLTVPPALVRVLGAALRTPDLAVVLEGPGELLRARKPELDVSEVERQVRRWRQVLPAKAPTVAIDVRLSEDEVAAAVREAVVSAMERRAMRRLGPGWVRIAGRWWMPRGPRPSSRAGFALYQPPTRGRGVAWATARAFAAGGGLRLLPRSEAPPRRVRMVLGPHVPPRGTYAVARANHEGRYAATLLDGRGAAAGFAKVATSDDDAIRLSAEADAIQELGPLLPPPLSAPEVRARDHGFLLLEQVDWMPRAEPWVLPEEVAFALGGFSRHARHGDVAPWNLLRTRDGWVLLDWESAVEGDGGFDDLCHHIAVTFALLGTPDEDAVIEGFCDLRGPVAAAVRAFAEGAGRDPREALPSLRAYLEAGSIVGLRTQRERVGRTRLEALRIALADRGRCASS